MDCRSIYRGSSSLIINLFGSFHFLISKVFLKNYNSYFLSKCFNSINLPARICYRHLSGCRRRAFLTFLFEAKGAAARLSSADGRVCPRQCNIWHGSSRRGGCATTSPERREGCGALRGRTGCKTTCQLKKKRKEEKGVGPVTTQRHSSSLDRPASPSLVVKVEQLLPVQLFCRRHASRDQTQLVAQQQHKCDKAKSCKQMSEKKYAQVEINK